MKEYSFFMTEKGNYSMEYEGKKILIKRKIGGFIFDSSIFIDDELVLSVRLIQVLFFRQLTIQYSLFKEIKKESNRKFRINDGIILYKTKMFNINPNYSFFYNDKLVLECYVPQLLETKKYKLRLYQDEEKHLLYIICFFMIFSFNDIAIE